MTALKDQRILVTGAGGFLGSHLVHSLAAAGAKPIAHGRRAESVKIHADRGYPAWIKDLSESILSEDLSALGTLDAIVHVAARSAPWGAPALFERDNIAATASVARLARQTDSRVVHISSPAVYFRPRDQHEVREDTPLPRPVNAYAATKRCAEDIVRATLEDQAIILRPRGIYGPGDTALIPRLLRAAEARPLPLMRGGQACTDLTYVSDAVSAIHAALCARPDAWGETFNISGGDALNIRGVIDSVCFQAGIGIRWRVTPTPLARMGARVVEAASLWRGSPHEPLVTPYSLGLLAYTQTLDLSKAERLLGWSPEIPFETGFTRTMEALFP
jgi:nucleoside-diphosphate-sugar epimerase